MRKSFEQRHGHPRKPGTVHLKRSARRAGAAIRLERDLIELGAILDGPSNQFNWKNRSISRDQATTLLHQKQDELETLQSRR